MSPSRLTMASVEKQQAFSFSRSYYLISQTSCVSRGARLGRIKKEDTSGRKRQRLTPLNQLSSRYFIVHCVELLTVNCFTSRLKSTTVNLLHFEIYIIIIITMTHVEIIERFTRHMDSGLQKHIEGKSVNNSGEVFFLFIWKIIFLSRSAIIAHSNWY